MWNGVEILLFIFGLSTFLWFTLYMELSWSKAMGVYEEKPDKDKYDIPNKKQHTVLANSRAMGYKIKYK